MRPGTKAEIIAVTGRSRAALERAARILRAGGLVAFPTETVYGLGAKALDRRAIARLYRAKRRARNKPCTIMIADRRAVRRMGCRVTPAASRVMERFWPGPLTVILKARSGKRVGFRVPRHSIALKLVRLVRVPLAVPSANISGTRAPKTAGAVARQLAGVIDLILDGGRADIGIASTVVDLTAAPRVLRKGAITEAEIRAVYG